MGVLVKVYMNWTCTGCGTVNYITVEEKEKIMAQFDPKYKGRTEIIKCTSCKSQVSLEARTHDSKNTNS